MGLLKGKNTKHLKPIQRKFWNYLKYMPAGLEKKLVRSQFEIDYSLPSEFIFKQAETEDEIRQGLKIVHDAYVKLNYIDPIAAAVRFTKFHALPNTVILVAKYKEEVIGTIAIIPDSSMGLPCDITWPLDQFRNMGYLIAEISSLAIKREFRSKRGAILFPLVKTMFEYCRKILKLDYIVMASTHEVESFYKHIYLFEKIAEKTGQEHNFVKGNPSTCMYLNIMPEIMEQNFLNSYSNSPSKRNLHEYIFKFDCPNIILPKEKKSLTAINLRDNHAKLKLINKNPELIKDFTNKDRIVLDSLDPLGIFNYGRTNLENEEVTPLIRIRTPRMEVRFALWIFTANKVEPQPASLLDVSENGFQLKLNGDNINIKSNFNPGTQFSFVIRFDTHLIAGKAQVRWQKSHSRLGCEILKTTDVWTQFIQEINNELASELNGLESETPLSDATQNTNLKKIA